MSAGASIVYYSQCSQNKLRISISQHDTKPVPINRHCTAQTPDKTAKNQNFRRSDSQLLRLDQST